MCIYIYIYIEREREVDRVKQWWSQGGATQSLAALSQDSWYITIINNNDIINIYMHNNDLWLICIITLISLIQSLVLNISLTMLLVLIMLLVLVISILGNNAISINDINKHTSSDHINDNDNDNNNHHDNRARGPVCRWGRFLISLARLTRCCLRTGLAPMAAPWMNEWIMIAKLRGPLAGRPHPRQGHPGII